jgi:hypothetical protein
MEAIAMRGRLTGERISGYSWAGPGESGRKKENHFQLEHSSLVTALFASEAGSFWFRCLGAACRVTLKGPKGQVLATAVLAPAAWTETGCATGSPAARQVT